MTIVRGPNVPYDGVNNAAASAGALELDSLAGAGSSIFKSGSGWHGTWVEWTSPRSGVKAISGPNHEELLFFRIPGPAPASAAPFMSFNAAGSVSQAALRYNATRHLELRDGPAGTTATSTNTYLVNTNIQAILEVYQDPDTGSPYQRARIFTDEGVPIETFEHTCGAATIVEYEEGPRLGTAGFAIRTDYATLASDEHLDEIIDVDSASTLIARVGWPRHHAFQVALKTTLADGVRLRISDITGAYLFTTADETPDADGYSKIDVNGLDPKTKYLWQTELLVAGVWVQGTGERDSGSCKTAIKAGEPGSYLMLLRACQRPADNRPAWEQIVALNADLDDDQGDRGYANLDTTTVATHRASHELVDDSVWGVRTINRTVAGIYMQDDHDSNGGNNGWKTAGLTAAKTAYRQGFPHPPQWNLATEDVLSFTLDYGTSRHIVWDFRSLAADDKIDHNDPDATPLGPEQEAEWFAQLDAAVADPTVKVTFLGFSSPLLGPVGGGDKHDWPPYWPGFLERVVDKIVTIPYGKLVILQGDNHLLNADTGSNTGAWGGHPVISSAGTKEDTGNWRGGWTPEYGYGLQTNHDPLQVIQTVKYEDLDGFVRVTATAYNLADAEILWEVPLLEIGDESLARAVIFADEFKVRDYARSILVLSDATAGKRGENLVVETAIGRDWNDGKVDDEGNLDIVLWADGTDEDGFIAPDQRVKVRENVTQLVRIFTPSHKLVTMREVDGDLDRRLKIEVKKPVVFDRKGSQGKIIVPGNSPKPYWEDTNLITQTLAYDNSGDVLVFTAFAGGNAPNDDLKIILGNFIENPRVTDNITDEWMEFDGQSDTDDELVFDCGNWSVYKASDPNVDRGDQVDQKHVGPLLIVEPRASDGAYALKITSTDDGGSNYVTLIGRRKWKLRG